MTEKSDMFLQKSGESQESCSGPQFRNPLPTVDTIIRTPSGEVVLIERKNEPFGWALPGGFIEYGESAEEAAKREALEETGLSISLIGLLGVYSEPGRDPRFHTLSVVYIADTDTIDRLQGMDDAKQAAPFSLDRLPKLMAFDHQHILKDYQTWLQERS